MDEMDDQEFDTQLRAFFAEQQTVSSPWKQFQVAVPPSVTSEADREMLKAQIEEFGEAVLRGRDEVWKATLRHLLEYFATLTDPMDLFFSEQLRETLFEAIDTYFVIPGREAAPDA